jgi:ferrous iron transport protein B
MVAVDVLLGRGEDLPPVGAVVCIVDASNLERHLYLVSQVLELGLPTVLALNMLDVSAEQGIAIDAARLERQLGIPVVPMRANRGIGVEELKTALARVVGAPVAARASVFPAVFETEVTRLEELVAAFRETRDWDRLGRRARRRRFRLRFGSRFPEHGHPCQGPAACGGPRATVHALPRALIRRLLLDTSGYLQSLVLPPGGGRLDAEIRAARDRLAAAGCDVPGIETKARYAWVYRVLDGAVTQPGHYKATWSDRVDRVLTHRVFGTLVFAAMMLVVFQSVFVWAEPLMNAIDAVVKSAGEFVTAHMDDGALRSLLADGVVAGVGGVLTFLPQILVLFFFLALLEDCGYMARAAYLMDTLMVRVGLSGKSFIPLLSSFACAIPGIMATRVIENERDRLTTILVAPLMTCSARLPVYGLLIAAFVPETSFLGGWIKLRGITLAAFYLLGILVAVLVARLLKKTLLRGKAPPFLMELPSYKWPSARTVFHRVVERAFSFVRFAGTLILAVSIVVWAALYYPHDPEAIDPALRADRHDIATRIALLAHESPDRAVLAGRLDELDRAMAAAYQRQSCLGRFGRAIEPVFRPLGWDWRIGSAVLASFPAREVVVATLGVIFDLGGEPDATDAEAQTRFQAKLREATWDGDGRPLFTLPVALSLMVFYALCAQCAATLAVIRHETNSWRWPLFTFFYMTALAYTGALATYQVGTWLAG